MKSVTVLMLGGPADGERRAVETYGEFEPPAPYHIVQEREPLPPAGWRDPGPVSPTKIAATEHAYKRHIFTSQGGRPRWVYVHPDLRGVDLLDHILLGYRNSK